MTLATWHPHSSNAMSLGQVTKRRSTKNVAVPPVDGGQVVLVALR
jgi:hypothetical protein